VNEETCNFHDFEESSNALQYLISQPYLMVHEKLFTGDLVMAKLFFFNKA
jgi:hypothetical protein